MSRMIKFLKVEKELIVINQRKVKNLPFMISILKKVSSETASSFSFRQFFLTLKLIPGSDSCRLLRKYEQAFY